MIIFINSEQTPITSTEQLDDKGDYKFYFVCQKCGKVKSKRHYSRKPATLICQGCGYKEVIQTKYNGQNPGMAACKKSMLKKYGTTSTAQFQDYSHRKDGSAKRRQTNLAKYGTENAAQSESVKAKTKATNLKRYGFSSASKSEAVRAKQKETLRTKYPNGMPGPAASHQRFLEKRQQQVEKLDLTWLDADQFRGKYDSDGSVYYHFRCNKCGNEFSDSFHTGMPICRVCNPQLVGISRPEKDLAAFIKSISSEEVIENDRTVLNGKELDIYLPNKKLAIEFNGTYWHGYRADSGDVNEFVKKHQEKRLACQKLGIRLINIDEADYLDRPLVFQRFIMDCVCPRIRIFARKCELKNIDDKTARDFCEFYHVNGYRAGSTKFGLYYKDELICVAIFAKHPKYENECIRLCYKTGVDIIGGWKKIQKHFGKKFLHYVNLNYFEGENKTGCGYRIWWKKSLWGRRQLIKSQLEKMIQYDKTKSAFFNVIDNSGIAIFDQGNDIRIYN